MTVNRPLLLSNPMSNIIFLIFVSLTIYRINGFHSKNHGGAVTDMTLDKINAVLVFNPIKSIPETWFRNCVNMSSTDLLWFDLLLTWKYLVKVNAVASQEQLKGIIANWLKSNQIIFILTSVLFRP